MQFRTACWRAVSRGSGTVSASEHPSTGAILLLLSTAVGSSSGTAGPPRLGSIVSRLVVAHGDFKQAFDRVRGDGLGFRRRVRAPVHVSIGSRARGWCERGKNLCTRCVVSRCPLRCGACLGSFPRGAQRLLGKGSAAPCTLVGAVGEGRRRYPWRSVSERPRRS